MALLIPYAFDEQQKIVHISDAEIGYNYFCIECGGWLIQKRGKIKSHHFAHATKTSSCSEESLVHKLAKLLVCDIVKKKATVNVIKKCSRCNMNIEYCVDMGEHFEGCKLEERHGDFIADVMIFGKDGSPRLAVEIFHTHTLPEEKTKKYMILWIELNASSIITSHIHGK